MVRRNRVIGDLMEKFVCLRMIQMNGVDLAQFQFDFDMSFGVFFMNADGTIYGRYGTRNQRPDHADSEISLEGLRAAMLAALSLHGNYPNNKDSLIGKKGPKPMYNQPEQYPPLTKYTPRINYENDVAKSCIHCHQIHNAERQVLRDAKKTIPDRILYLYPMPGVVGIGMDPKSRAKILKVVKNSASEQAGLRPGDEILHAAGQPLISVADFQWVLHQTPGNEGSIPLKVLREGKVGNIELKLPPGWREKTDFSWRVSTWDLSRMVLGGMRLEPDSRSPLGLKVKSAGKYGAHGVARRAGVRPDDRLVEIGGLSERSTEAEVIAHLLSTTRKGDKISVKLQRGSRELDLVIPAQ